ncbi:hypothetical protein D3C78_1667060 [compost metagenome]
MILWFVREVTQVILKYNIWVQTKLTYIKMAVCLRRRHLDRFAKTGRMLTSRFPEELSAQPIGWMEIYCRFL